MPILKNIYIQRFPSSALLLAQVCNINRVWSAKNFSFLCQIIYFSDEIDELEWRSVILSDQTPMLRDSVSGRPFFDGSRGNWEKASFWPIWKNLPDPLALAFLPPLVQKKELKNGSYLESRIEYIQEWVVFVCLNFLELPPNGLSPGRRQDTDFFPGHGLWALSLCGHVETFHIGQTFLSLQGPSRSVLHNKCIANRNSIVLTYLLTFTTYLHTYYHSGLFLYQKSEILPKNSLSRFLSSIPKKVQLYTKLQNCGAHTHTQEFFLNPDPTTNIWNYFWSNLILISLHFGTF